MLDIGHANYSKTLPRMLLWVEEGQERARARACGGCSKATGGAEQNMAEKASNLKRKIGVRRVSRLDFCCRKTVFKNK